MNLTEVETNIELLNVEQGFDLIFELLLAYGLPKASVTRLRKGSLDKSAYENEALWKGKLFYRYVETGEADLHALIDATETDDRVIKNKPRFLIVRDDEQLLAVDTKTRDTLDIKLADLPKHTAFFLPWAGIEKTAIENANVADVKAAEKMARLYDEITKVNKIEGARDIHALNVFFSRLLFCFFAEDTEVFELGQFTNAVASYTQESGGDVSGFLDQLFAVMNTPEGERGDVGFHLDAFGYVNGRLFAASSPAPIFSAKARRILLECGELDWASINPDIFGSMIQAVVHPGDRESLGMHYTSVENIMKVLRPLLLDELEDEFEKASDSVNKLDKLLDRAVAIKVFDPACGSGNFLVIAYKELRRLEHRILQRITELEPGKAGLFQLSRIELDRFYGIEIDDFAHEVAILSLWLAKHQMNVEFKELFGVEISLIPLKESGSIVAGNALRMDWEDVCPVAAGQACYVAGNPPYRGGKLQDSEQKSDLAEAFSGRNFSANMDYVCGWFIKGAEFAARNRARVAFVSTNSVCQGTHVSMLWPHVYQSGADIEFAHRSFKWTNSARGNAGVTCVVIGLGAAGSNVQRKLYGTEGAAAVTGITPYLTPGDKPIIVADRSSQGSGLPPMSYGSMARDGGGLILTQEERDALLRESPEAAGLLKNFYGADDFLNHRNRFCLWIEDEQLEYANSVASIRARSEQVAAFRQASKAPSTQSAALSPLRFVQRAHRPGTSIIAPMTTSERREYVPFGFLDGSSVISNSANAIYDAEPWLFGLIQSRLHMVWMRAVGSRMKSDYRYSSTLVYNTFPVPKLYDADRAALSAGALKILAAREASPGETIAQMYDPDEMPAALRAAHGELDETVDRIYRDKPFASDEERLALLFNRYGEMIAEEEAADA
jgi:hypothetical protein